jgi:hypothetical protein
MRENHRLVDFCWVNPVTEGKYQHDPPSRYSEFLLAILNNYECYDQTQTGESVRAMFYR